MSAFLTDDDATEEDPVDSDEEDEYEVKVLRDGGIRTLTTGSESSLRSEVNVRQGNTSNRITG